MMNGYLILVKHSLPEILVYLPAREWRLSEEGRRRAGRLAERLVSYHPERLISSSEPKARETAEIIGDRLPLPVDIRQDLHEHDRSNVAYLSKEEFEGSVIRFFDNPDSLVFGSETANEAHARFSRAVYSSLIENGNGMSILVSHGTVISLFVSRLTGQPAFQIWRELGLPGFIVLDMQSKNMIVLENIL